MTKWQNYKHFSGWLNLCPNSKISGGKTLSSKAMKKKNRAGQILKQAVSTLVHNKGHLGDYYRKMRAKLGGRGAVMAAANKISRIIYMMLLNKKEYNPEIIISNEEKHNEI
jgi:transposase